MRPRHSMTLHRSGWAVYPAYDATGGLLYIGMAVDLQARLGGHRQGSRWYDMAATVEWEECDSEAEARALERRLIRALRPPHNKVHNGHHHVDATPEWVREHRTGSVLRRVQRERGVHVAP